MRWFLLALLLSLATPAHGAVPHAAALLRASAESGVPFDLLARVARVESGYDAGARSPDGSLGLLQLKGRTGRAMARKLGIAWEPFHAETNARCGAAYLREQLDRFGDVALALQAYALGPSRVDRLRRAGQRVPMGYALKVLQVW